MYNVSSSPHVKSKVTTQSIMRDVIIALMPATIFGIYNYSHLFGAKYGLRSALLIILTVVACVLSEYVFEKIIKRESTLDELSAVVTGLLLALNMPVSASWWMPIVGSAFAIIIAKQLFGDQELQGAKKVLTAAALTYVAALASSILQLLRLIILAGGRDRD